MSETGAPTNPTPPDSPDGPGPWPLVTCHNCGRQVPDGEFCGACGAHLVAPTAASAHRAHAYAAEPTEHLLHLSVISTLFPHLPHRNSAPFRLALLLGAGLLLILGLLRLTGPSIAAAALLVPLLYLVYLYEVEVYEDEPLLVIGATLVLGALLGIPYATWTGPYITQTLLASVTLGLLPDRVVVSAVAFPLLAQLLMLLGPLLIYATRRYDEALDGFTFGAAAALGFTLTTTMIDLWPTLQAGLISNVPVTNNVLDILQRGLLTPFLNASTTGLIAGALWLSRGPTRALRVHGWTTSLASVIVFAVLVRVALGLATILTLSTVVVVAVYLIITMAALLWVRIALHHMLLAEAVEVRIGPPQPCFHCHRVVPRMAFCPHCGIATRATPKTGAGRLGRVHRSTTALEAGAPADRSAS